MMTRKLDKFVESPVDELDDLIQIMKQEHLDEIEISEADSHIKLVKEPKVTSVPWMGALPGAATASTVAPQEVLVPQEEGAFVYAPIAGVLYRSPSPALPPFVKEGDLVSAGQPLCIIEAMKVMNEIAATASGIVKKIKVENGKPVEANQILFVIAPS
jgi:acetyl-CoA carboxylase biotin carboxyl carrier protein